MKHLLFSFILLALIFMVNCQDEPTDYPVLGIVTIDDLNVTHLLFSSIEYNLYIRSKADASKCATELSKVLNGSLMMYCAEDFVHVKKLITGLEQYSKQVLRKSENWSLEKLRDLKSQFMNIQTEDDYDPYIYSLWKYEEEMFYVTKAAIDPKLDLYEWGEYLMMVDCMNECWQAAQLHYPTMELFGNNSLAYKVQMFYKVALQESMIGFNKAVQSEDYLKYNLCDYGVDLRESYVKYIKSFVDQEEELKPFLATL